MKGKGRRRNSTKVKIKIEPGTPLIVSDCCASTSKSKGSLKKGGTIVDFTSIKTWQEELEQKLITKCSRKILLEKKLRYLETKQTKLRKRSRSTDSLDKKCLEEKPPKKIKDHTSKAHSSSTNQIKFKMFQPPFPDPHLEVSKGQKNDGPSRFWGFIEPYCADINQDNIRAIEEWIRASKSYEKYLTIPELGQHFTLKWPFEDIIDEIKEGSKSVENPRGLFTDSNEDHEEAERIKKLGENECSTEVDDQYAPMVDRLVYSLVEENLMTASDDTLTESFDDGPTEIKNPSVAQPPKVNKNCSLEKRFLMDFLNAGLLENEHMESDNAEDEVCSELKRLQNALIPVQEYNLLQMKKLLCLAKAEMAKQEVRRKLREMDAKVMELYRTVAAARKNKTMNKKLEDQAKRLLRERKKISDKLENIT